MNQPRRERRDQFLYSPGGWDNPLPPALQLAAELSFGTFLVLAVVTGIKRGVGAGAILLAFAVLPFTITRFRCANSPAAWWISVVMFTGFGAFLCVVVLTI